MANERDQHPALKFFVNNEEIEVHTSELTVQEILDAAGFKPAADYFLVEVNQTGQEGAKHERLDLAIKLHGGEHFIAVHRGKEEYFYFVDGTKFESKEPHTTGIAIKSNLPESKRGYALYLEGQGSQSDVLINDDTSVDLKGPPRHFYTVPPASFGSA